MHHSVTVIKVYCYSTHTLLMSVTLYQRFPTWLFSTCSVFCRNGPTEIGGVSKQQTQKLISHGQFEYNFPQLDKGSRDKIAGFLLSVIL